MSNSPQTASVILAGGLSSRMGTDKALLRLTPEGPTLIETVAERLSEAGLPPAFVVGGPKGGYPGFKAPTVPDEVADAGPLGGILTALLHSPSPRTLVVACDMPLLNSELLRFMAALMPDTEAVIPRWTDTDGTSRVEPLHAIYARSCIEPIRRRIDSGRLKLSDALADLRVHYIEDAELRRLDPGLSSFRNVNTPDEWSRYGSSRLR